VLGGRDGKRRACHFTLLFRVLADQAVDEQEPLINLAHRRVDLIELGLQQPSLLEELVAATREVALLGRNGAQEARRWSRGSLSHWHDPFYMS
jgi:hypothetical protein